MSCAICGKHLQEELCSQKQLLVENAVEHWIKLDFNFVDWDWIRSTFSWLRGFVPRKACCNSFFIDWFHVCLVELQSLQEKGSSWVRQRCTVIQKMYHFQESIMASLSKICQSCTLLGPRPRWRYTKPGKDLAKGPFSRCRFTRFFRVVTAKRRKGPKPWNSYDMTMTWLTECTQIITGQA